MRRPLRSKRAITSPVRARSKASGLTRIRVRLTARAPLVWFRAGGLWRGVAGRLLAGGFRGGFLRRRGRFLAAGGRAFRYRLLGLGFATGASLLGLGLRAPRLFLRPALALVAAGEGRLAVGAEAPARVDRLVAGRAGVLEAALAIGAAEVGLLHRVLAVRAGLLAQLAHLELGGVDLQLALVGVLEQLRRAHHGVDGRADIGDEGRDGGAGDQERVRDAAARVGGGGEDQRGAEHDRHQDKEGRDQVEAAVGDAEDR